VGRRRPGVQGREHVEKQGRPVAEIRPLPELAGTRPLPDREEFFRSLSFVALDSGKILEEDRF
jgi:hypothetical protein